MIGTKLTYSFCWGKMKVGCQNIPDLGRRKTTTIEKGYQLVRVINETKAIYRKRKD